MPVGTIACTSSCTTVSLRKSDLTLTREAWHVSYAVQRCSSSSSDPATFSSGGCCQDDAPPLGRRRTRVTKGPFLQVPTFSAVCSGVPALQLHCVEYIFLALVRCDISCFQLHSSQDTHSNIHNHTLFTMSAPAQQFKVRRLLDQAPASCGQAMNFSGSSN